MGADAVDRAVTRGDRLRIEEALAVAPVGIGVVAGSAEDIPAGERAILHPANHLHHAAERVLVARQRKLEAGALRAPPDSRRGRYRRGR